MLPEYTVLICCQLVHEVLFGSREFCNVHELSMVSDSCLDVDTLFWIYVIACVVLAMKNFFSFGGSRGGGQYSACGQALGLSKMLCYSGSSKLYNL